MASHSQQHEELDTHHKMPRQHTQSAPRAGEGLPVGAARLGRAALHNLLLELQVHAKPLFDSRWMQEESVKQTEYAYYSFELRERKVLVITVETSHGATDIFVSNDTHTPSQAEHSWRSAGSGDDVVEVSPEHPRYAYPCAYYVAVLGRPGPSDSELNIRA